MSDKLELLSNNLVQIIERCANSEELAKLLYYNDSVNPLSKDIVQADTIAPLGKKERILPYPFDVKFKSEQRSQLHIYYPELNFVGDNIEEVFVWFDIVVHKRLWLYSQDNKKLVRPYQLASQIARLFDGAIPNTKSTVGKLHFKALGHVAVNEEFDGIRLEALMTNF